MPVLLVNGSMSKKSNTGIILNRISDFLILKGVNTKIIKIDEFDLEIFNPNIDISNEVLLKLEIFKKYDTIIFGSPEYHGSFTGALKNLLDYLDKSDLENKTVGIVATSGSFRCGLNTLNSLRIVLRNLHCNVITNQLSIYEEEINPISKTSKRIEQFTQDLIFEADLRRNSTNYILA